MQVRRAERMAAGAIDPLAHRSVGRDRIELRQDALEPVFAIAIGAQAAAGEQRVVLVGVLHVVDAVTVGLPHIKHRIRDRLAVRRAHGAADEGRFAGRPHRQVIAILEIGGLVGMKRAEHRGFGAACRLLVVQRHHQHRQAQRIGQQDHLLAFGVALLAHRCQVFDALHPLLFGQLDLTRELMQMLGQTGENLLETRVLAALQAANRFIGDGVFVEVLHGAVL